MPTTSTPLTSGRKPDDAGGYLPRKTFDVEFKSIDEQTGEFSLYCACFGNIDRQKDLIEPASFRNLDAFVNDGFGLVNHDQKALPVAYPTSATQDSKGLLISGVFHSTDAAQACRTVVKERMAAGKTVKASLGYVVLDESYEKRDGQTIRHIKALDIYEFSFVGVPANPRAEVTSVKGAEMSESEDKGSIIDALKELLGLTVKGGRALSKANHTRLKAFAESMDEHGKAAVAHGKAGCKMAGEMKEFLAPYDPDVKPPDGSEEETDDGEMPEEEAPRKKKPEKSQSLTQADEDAAVYRDQLKLRSLVGRSIHRRP